MTYTREILTEAVFRGLYPEYELLIVEDSFIAVPKGEMLPVFIGSSLAAISFQIAKLRGAPGIPPDSVPALAE